MRQQVCYHNSGTNSYTFTVTTIANTKAQILLNLSRSDTIGVLHESCGIGPQNRMDSRIQSKSNCRVTQNVPLITFVYEEGYSALSAFFEIHSKFPHKPFRRTTIYRWFRKLTGGDTPLASKLSTNAQLISFDFSYTLEALHASPWRYHCALRINRFRRSPLKH